MPDKQNDTHNSEYIYKMPFVEHEYMMYKASRIRRRIVMALAITNAFWLVVTAFILLFKK
jgi:hypothetical protein